MGSEASSGMILFIAAITAAAVAGGAMASVVGKMTFQVQERGEGIADAMGTDLAIVNDPQNVPYDAGAEELTLYVKNTGSTTLLEEELLVLVDGTHTTVNTTLLDNATRWDHGVTAEVTVNVTLTSGDHRAKVVHTPNVADEMDFRT